MKKVLVLALMTVFGVSSIKMNATAADCAHKNTRIQVRTETTTYCHDAEVNFNGICQILVCEVTREVDKAVKVCVFCGEELDVGDIVASRESHSIMHN